MKLKRITLICAGAFVAAAILVVALLHREPDVPVFEDRCDFQPLTEQEYQARFHDLQPAASCLGETQGHQANGQ